MQSGQSLSVDPIDIPVTTAKNDKETNPQTEASINATLIYGSIDNGSNSKSVILSNAVAGSVNDDFSNIIISGMANATAAGAKVRVTQFSDSTFNYNDVKVSGVSIAEGNADDEGAFTIVIGSEYANKKVCLNVGDSYPVCLAVGENGFYTTLSQEKNVAASEMKVQEGNVYYNFTGLDSENMIMMQKVQGGFAPEVFALTTEKLNEMQYGSVEVSGNSRREFIIGMSEETDEIQLVSRGDTEAITLAYPPEDDAKTDDSPVRKIVYALHPDGKHLFVHDTERINKQKGSNILIIPTDPSNPKTVLNVQSKYPVSRRTLAWAGKYLASIVKYNHDNNQSTIENENSNIAEDTESIREESTNERYNKKRNERMRSYSKVMGKGIRLIKQSNLQRSDEEWQNHSSTTDELPAFGIELIDKDTVKAYLNQNEIVEEENSSVAKIRSKTIVETNFPIMNPVASNKSSISDEKFIVYSCKPNAEKPMQICESSLDNPEKIKQLTDFNGMTMQPAISLHNDLVAFTLVDEQGKMQLYVLHRHSGDLIPIMNFEKGLPISISQPSFLHSPDMAHIMTYMVTEADGTVYPGVINLDYIPKLQSYLQQ